MTLTRKLTYVGLALVSVWIALGIVSFVLWSSGSEGPATATTEGPTNYAPLTSP